MGGWGRKAIRLGKLARCYVGQGWEAGEVWEEGIMVWGKDNGSGLLGGGEKERQVETLPWMRLSFDCNEKSGDFTAGSCVEGVRSSGNKCEDERACGHRGDGIGR